VAIEWLGVIGFILIFVLLLAGVHIGVAMGLIGLLGIVIIRGLDVGLTAAVIVPHATIASYDLAILPFFLLMGEFAVQSGGVAGMFDAAKAWFGRLPGGMAITTLAVSGGLAATTGSSLASTAMMTRIAVPELEKQGYSKATATGIIATCGTLAVLIPPSVFLVYYAIMSGESVGKLLLAGFLPGFATMIVFFAYITVTARLSPQIEAAEASMSWKKRLMSLRKAWAIILVLGVIFGGLYMGVFTPTEVGAVGAFITFVLMLGNRQGKWTNVRKALMRGLASSSMIMIIIVGAHLFSRFLALSGLTTAMSNFIVGLEVSRWIKFTGIVLSYIFLGCFLEAFAMLSLTLPIYYPVIVQMGFDPIWFGIICVVMVEVGAISPPFGLTVYTAKGIAGPDVEVMDVFRAAAPFIVLQLMNVAMLCFFPQIALFLPSTAKL